MIILTIFLLLFFNFNRHFLPFRRADLTASASLQDIRSRIYGFIPCALYLRQAWLVNNSG